MIASTGTAAASLIASHATDATRNGCTSNNHPRRCPNRANPNGGRTSSNTGAHRNFNVYDNPIFAVSPMASNDTPPSVSHCRKVNPDNANGSPDTNPNAAITRRRRSEKKAGDFTLGTGEWSGA